MFFKLGVREVLVRQRQPRGRVPLLRPGRREGRDLAEGVGNDDVIVVFDSFLVEETDWIVIRA